MSLDDKLRSSSLETYATLDADNGVAYVGIAANGIRGTDLLDLLNGLDLVIELLTVDGSDLTFLEGNLQSGLLLFGSDMLQISLFGQSLCGIKQFATTNAGTPDAYII